MKHLKVLSTERPVKAEQVAFVQLKDLIAPTVTPKGSFTPTTMTGTQTAWLAAQWDNFMQK